MFFLYGLETQNLVFLFVSHPHRLETSEPGVSVSVSPSKAGGSEPGVLLVSHPQRLETQNLVFL